ncbi:MAG: hypothetical protein ACI83Y_001226 [Candidatus Azotimanducaceae bacterium]
MLRASRRVLRPGGRLAFHTIELPPELTPSEATPGDLDRAAGGDSQDDLSGPAPIRNEGAYCCEPSPRQLAETPGFGQALTDYQAASTVTSRRIPASQWPGMWQPMIVLVTSGSSKVTIISPVSPDLRTTGAIAPSSS